MVKYFLLSCFLIWNFYITSQSFWESDTTANRVRTIGTSVTVATGWSGSMMALSQVWYKDSWTGGFRFFNDGKEWLQMDKFGHAYTANHITRNVFNAYRWSGQSRNKSLWLGGLVGFGYLANLEVFDGLSEDWGFSWWDMAANTAGVGWFIGQELLWQEQRVLFKFSASLSPYAKYRPEVLGSSFSERILKDYNGQTYWFSASPSTFIENIPLPPWLAFSIGYSIDGKLHGMDDMYEVNVNGATRTYYAERQLLFSLDIDFERIQTNNSFLKAMFKALNHLKVPFPTLLVSPSSTRFVPFYF